MSNRSKYFLYPHVNGAGTPRIKLVTERKWILKMDTRK